MNRLISIIVPVYNKERFLVDCIESIRAQTYPEIELLLVDDGSTDASARICQDFCTKDARIRYFYQKNAGQNAARQTGAEKARGDWLIFVDADDMVTPQMCSLLMENMEATHADFIHSAHQMLNEHGLGVITNEHSGVYTGKNIIETFYFEKNAVISHDRGRKSPSTSMCATLFRTERIRSALRDFDMRVRLSEDTACLLSMLLAATKVSYIPEVTYYYRQVEGSVSHKHTYNMVQHICRFGQFLIQRFRAAGLPLEDDHVIDGKMLYLLLYYGLEYFDDYPGIFPFVPKHPAGRIALYGAGMFGEEFYAKEHERLSVIGWFDRAFERYQERGLDVRDPRELRSDQFDVIIVTIRRLSTAREVASELRRQFPDKMICMISEEILASEYTRKKLRVLRGC